MNVLHFYKTYRPETFGGIEQVIYQLANGITKSGIETSVLTITGKKEFGIIKLNDHNVYQCKRSFQIASTDFSLKAILKFKELAASADIIHYHYPWPFMDLVHFLTKPNKPTVLTYHSDIIKQTYLKKLYSPLMHRFLNDVDVIVATSPNYFNTSSILQIYKEKVEVIPIGIDKESYPQPDLNKLEYWEEKLGNKFFLFVGVLRYYKGLQVLLESLAYIDYPMVILGSGPMEKELKSKAVELGLRNLIFVGQLAEEDKQAVIALSYALIFPSNLRSEAFGVALLEASIFVKPMISCEIGTGTSYVNIDGETGFVVSPSSPIELHLAMKFLWKHPKVSRKMAQNALERYKELFTAKRMTERYITLYSEILKKKYNKQKYSSANNAAINILDN